MRQRLLPCGHWVSEDMYRIAGDKCPTCEQKKDEAELDALATLVLVEHLKNQTKREEN